MGVTSKYLSVRGGGGGVKGKQLEQFQCTG